MSLYSEWKELIENQSNDSIDDFWQEYSDAETRIYSGFLDDYKNGFSGNFKELADKYETRPVIFMNDPSNEVTIVLDPVITAAPDDELLNFHPNTNTATLSLTKSDFIRFLDAQGNKYV